MNHLSCLAPAGLAALALTLPAAHAGPAATTDAARRAIQSAYDASDAAAARKDAAGTLAHFTPEAVSVDIKGHSTSMAQERQTVARLFAAAQSVAAHTTIQKFTLDRPGQASVTVHERHVIALTDPQTHQPSQFVVEDTARDLWVKTSQGWRQKRSQDLTSSSTLNGQPLPGQ